MSNKKLLVAIPAYNCSSQIGRVMHQYVNSSSKNFIELVVIDNCSLDITIKKAIEFANSHPHKKISIIQNEQNFNLGGTHKVAFQYVVDKNYDGIIVLHGDDQGRLSDIEPYLDEHNLTQYDCILGSRFMKGSLTCGYSKFRIFGNFIFNWLYSLFTQQKILDLGSGLNYFSRKTISKSIHQQMPDDLTFNSAFLLGVIAAGERIKFVPITWREEDQISNAKLWSQSIKLIQYLFKYSKGRANFLDLDLSPKKECPYSYKKIK
jgi:glycosyltransferase involved in cell wall biosynthesis